MVNPFRRSNGYLPIRQSSTSPSDHTRRLSVEPLEIDEHRTAFRPRRRNSLLRVAVGLLCCPWLCLRACYVRFSRTHKRPLFVLCIQLSLTILLALIVGTAVWNPSYTHRPVHYRGTNRFNESVIIAANIIDEDLIRGAWGNALLELIDRIGPENVYLSIYENDSGEGPKSALRDLAKKVKCKHSIVSGHIDISTIPTIQLLPDSHETKRIAYLAKVRNLALRPLDPLPIASTTEYPLPPDFIPASARSYDKLLFLNDVVFSPADAADLLFATNAPDPDSPADYLAACAVDYINPFKIYDRFATRDADAFRTGLPFFPFFTPAGSGRSRAHMLLGSDAVPVRSCWGGMVAFQAKWFLSQPNSPPSIAPRPENSALEAALVSTPLRFRAEPGLFWDASECCLIHADLSALSAPPAPHTTTAAGGILINPFIRVAYSPRSFAWLALARRFERLFTVPHTLAGWAIRAPWHQARRTEPVGETVSRRVWVFDGGAGRESGRNWGSWWSWLGGWWGRGDGEGKGEGGKGEKNIWASGSVAKYGRWEDSEEMASPGGFCGYYAALVLKDQSNWRPGEKIWSWIKAPAGY